MVIKGNTLNKNSNKFRKKKEWKAKLFHLNVTAEARAIKYNFLPQLQKAYKFQG